MIVKNIQVMRAIAANAVLLSHLFDVERKYSGVMILSSWCHLGSCGVDLFFTISGFIMMTIAQGCGWREFLAARVTRIYPPYWFYTTLVFCVTLIVPSFVNSSFHYEPSIWKSYLLYPQLSQPLLAVGWTLIHEMYFYIVFAVILAFALPRIWALAGWALFLFASSFILHDWITANSTTVFEVAAHPLTLEFILGALAGMAIQTNFTRFANTSLIAGIVGMFALPAIYNNLEILVDPNPGWVRVVHLGLPAALIIYGCAAREYRNGGSRAPQWMVKLGNASYSTYLSHVLVISAIGRVAALLPKQNSVVLEALFLIVALVCTNIYGLVSYRLIERPMLEQARRFFAWRRLKTA
jgi:peptidoglycan/LPS O-acetylase OafA/YrhL